MLQISYEKKFAFFKMAADAYLKEVEIDAWNAAGAQLRVSRCHETEELQRHDRADTCL